LKQADIEVVAGALKEGVVSRGGISKFKIINQTLSDNKNRSEVETKIYYETDFGFLNPRNDIRLWFLNYLC
jgi:hypothetical protein